MRAADKFISERQGHCRPFKSRLRLIHFDDTRKVGMKNLCGAVQRSGQEDSSRSFACWFELGRKGQCVDEIRRQVKMPGSTLSHHLDALTDAGC